MMLIQVSFFSALFVVFFGPGCSGSEAFLSSVDVFFRGPLSLASFLLDDLDTGFGGAGSSTATSGSFLAVFDVFAELSSVGGSGSFLDPLDAGLLSDFSSAGVSLGAFLASLRAEDLVAASEAVFSFASDCFATADSN